MYQTLKVTVTNGVQTIQLNRPKKMNAVNKDMYREIPLALRAGAEDDSVVVTVLTGAGKYYCSGNDMTGYLSADVTNMSEFVEDAALRLEYFVRSFIDYPKILVAFVNGPAIGIAATTLALCDLVYASDKATFSTPFSQLGLVAEGCSSYSFPKLMGNLKAAEMLCFGRKLNATEAKEWGLVSEIFPNSNLEPAWDKINFLAKLPSGSLMYSKRLMRSQDRVALYEANRRECEQLKERWQSEEFMNAVMNFFSKRQSKL